ncbi:ATP-dependent DNA/RNA helicase [Rhizina undulata]
MKRKHGQDTENPASADASVVDAEASFANLGLDARLLQAIAKLNFVHPTLVQAKAIPLALEGKDILARAKTGSGKTAAYLLPVLQSILKRKETSPDEKSTSALVLVPTRELAEQVHKMTEKLSIFCGKYIKTVNIAQNVSEQVQQSLLSEQPDIVIATPSRALIHINISSQTLTSKLTHLVIDEADLVLSYGYEDDLQAVSKALPKGLQTFLMSATLTAEVETLKALFCRNPAILKLEEDIEEDGEGVSQFVVKCGEDEKFLLIYVIFKLKLIKGKCIIFVGDIDRCYRLKLFLEQFGLRSCVLNSELPVNSRLHIVEEFNKNVYEIIIATDENEVLGDEEDDEGESKIREITEGVDDVAMEDEAAEDVSQVKKPPKKKRKKVRRDKEYGVSRGIDFQNVACVLNFDLPTTSKSYTHRIGRTARAGKTGMAFSFVIPKELYGKHKPTSIESCVNDEKVLARIERHQKKRGKEVKPYHFDMKQVEAFRYRMDDALRAVTKVAIREARTRELRQELLASEKLKRHFEENPEDLVHLRHDGELRAARVQPHLKHVPEYLMPKTGKAGISQGETGAGFVSMRKVSDNRIRKARMKKATRGGRKSGGGRDPLKMFKGGRK